MEHNNDPKKNFLYYLKKGNSFFKVSNYDKAIFYYQKALELNPNHPVPLLNKGVIFDQLKRYDEALSHYDKAIALKPDYAEAFFNKGVIYHQLKRYDEALFHYDKAIALKPDYSKAWFNKGYAYFLTKLYDEALFHYDKAIALKSDYAEAFFNKGVIFFHQLRYDEALSHYDKAIALKPDYAEAFFNKGVIFFHQLRYDEALSHYDKAIALKPDYAEAFFNKAHIFSLSKRFSEAITTYLKAIQIDSNIDFLLGHFIRAKLILFVWDNIENDVNNLIFKVKENKKVVRPLTFLYLNDSQELALKVSKISNNSNFLKNTSEPFSFNKLKKKISIGYFSGDFRDHAVYHLVAELFELHDRNSFEIIAFSFNKTRNAFKETFNTDRLKNSFDQFIDVEDLSDEEVVSLSRKIGINIAVDLQGGTLGARPRIFNYRAAPIQVNYLGYPGTTGSYYMDYIIADNIVIPENNKNFFSEKIVYLPNSYQVNDTKKKISEKKFTRSEIGLPQTGFIFCCFNQNVKITPAIFNLWMKILKKVDGSILWLLEEDIVANNNLKKEAINKGVSSDRIIFSKKIDTKEHLSRISIADLFLDTFPYNAHTTASDSLWAGVPILTYQGQSFQSRVAASLLNAIDAKELIVNSLTEYESLAVELALNPSKLKAIKEKIQKNRLTKTLFNTSLYAGHLEKAYKKMYEIYQKNLLPDHIYIK